MPAAPSLNVLIAQPYKIYGNALIPRPSDWKLKPHVTHVYNQEDLLKELQQGNHNVLLLDENFYGMYFPAVKNLITQFPAVRIIYLTAVPCRLFVHELKKAGIAGLIHKWGKTENIRHALMAVLSGNYYQCPHYTQLFATGITPMDENTSLTFSEKAILYYRVLGKELKEISDILQRKENCINGHIKKVNKKIGTNNVLYQFQYGIRHGILSYSDFWNPHPPP